MHLEFYPGQHLLVVIDAERSFAATGQREAHFQRGQRIPVSAKNST
jgi:hypothetical protein